MDSRKVPLPIKFIDVNGVMQINPAYLAAKAGKGAPATTVANPGQALAIISTADEMMTASSVKQQATGQPIQMSKSNIESVKMIQNPVFLEGFQAPDLDGGDLLEKLYDEFAKYEVPLGLVNKLMKLAERKLNFIIDDSGSMISGTDIKFSQATPQMQAQKTARQTSESYLNRWQEAQDRLHILIDLIGFIPTAGITIHSLSGTCAPLILNQQGLNPVDFIKQAHEQITRFFMKKFIDHTPIYTALTKAFTDAAVSVVPGQRPVPTMHYLFTDGVPNDADIETVKSLIKNRRDPENNALTLISCSDQDRDTEWLKEVEEEARFVAELDDYVSECKEVNHDQGPAFPYSKGMWLICNLVAAICPQDLDAIDESTPFSKFTLGNILGRKLTEQEYGHYFNLNPNNRIWRGLYAQLSSDTQEVVAVNLAHEVRQKCGLVKDAKIEESHVRTYASQSAQAVSTSVGYGYSQSSSSAPQPNVASYMGPPPPYAQTYSTFAPAPSAPASANAPQPTYPNQNNYNRPGY